MKKELIKFEEIPMIRETYEDGSVLMYRDIKKVYYHGTDKDGISAILESKTVGVRYFDKYGFYLTSDIEVAKNHGHYILVFKDIDESLLETDDTNDGLFHDGKLPISGIDSVTFGPNDRRVIKDILMNL